MQWTYEDHKRDSQERQEKARRRQQAEDARKGTPERQKRNRR